MIFQVFETRGQNVPDRKLTVLAIEGKTHSAVMLYREGSLFRLHKWHIDGSWPPVGSFDRLPRVASYRMIGPPLPYNVHADVYTILRNIRPLCLGRMRKRKKSLRWKKLEDKREFDSLLSCKCFIDLSNNDFDDAKFQWQV